VGGGHTEIGERGATARSGTRRWSACPSRSSHLPSLARFRLLLKGTLMEFYLDDILIESFALPANASDRIGL